MHDLPPSTITGLVCSICGEPHDDRVVQTICTVCGRVLVARYDLEVARRTFSREALGQREASLWRYWEVLPLRDPSARVSLGEGMTPLLPTCRLAAGLGMQTLYVKDEGQNPTGSFKARGLAAAVSKFAELGVGKIALPTAGNAGGAAAAYGARGGMGVHVAMPLDAPQAMKDEVQIYGGELELVDGLISDAGHRVADLCKDSEWLNISTLKEPYRAEGKKTMGYELWEQLDGELPDAIFYPTGGGTGLIGMWQAFDELEAMGLIDSRRPRMIVVQAEGCAPIVRAFDAGAERAEGWVDASTSAPGIRVPTPFADDLILQVLRASDGDAVAVSEEELLAGMREIAAAEGIGACPEGGATFAGLRRLLDEGRLQRSDRVVLFNTGSGLKHPELHDH
ncbi:MAG: threonine synthase [Acidobacteriota bacterium]